MGGSVTRQLLRASVAPVPGPEARLSAVKSAKARIVKLLTRLCRPTLFESISATVDDKGFG